MTEPAPSRLSSPRVRLLLQLLITVIALGWVPGNALKLAIMFPAWLIGFGRLSHSELILMLLADAIFTGMNAAALSRGLFRFTQPDLLGMPLYEFLMWGFYILHTSRFVGIVRERPLRITTALVLAVLFSLPFSLTADPMLLLLLSGVVLAASIIFFHGSRDLASAGYMVFVGAIIEYVGVSTGQWSYPHPPLGGVPPWFITMWGGVGLFSHRLLVPMLRERSS